MIRVMGVERLTFAPFDEAIKCCDRQTQGCVSTPVTRIINQLLK